MRGLASTLTSVSAMRSLKQVTRDMAKQPGANKMKVESNVPLNAKAQKHMDGITQAMEGPKPKLFSALGQGIGLMRELRKTTRQMKQESMRARSTASSSPEPVSRVATAADPAGRGMEGAGVFLDFSGAASTARGRNSSRTDSVFITPGAYRGRQGCAI